MTAFDKGGGGAVVLARYNVSEDREFWERVEANWAQAKHRQQVRRERMHELFGTDSEEERE